jgi:hypothetical protein
MSWKDETIAQSEADQVHEIEVDCPLGFQVQEH